MLSDIKQRIREELNKQVEWWNPDEQLIGVQVGVIVDGYLDHYFFSDSRTYTTLDVEKELVNDVVNPETGRASTVFDHASKQDAFVVDPNGNGILVEHKTTSDDLRPDSPYWRRLAIDSQVSKYILSARQSGHPEVRECLYDVVSKPQTKPKRIVAADVRTIAEEGTYCGYIVPESVQKDVEKDYEANQGKRGGYQGKRDECLILYGLRLRGMVRDNPESFFGRQSVTRTDDEILQYSRELYQISADIRHSRKSGITPRNTSACYSYGTPCEYFAICCGEAHEQGQYTTVEQRHSEIETEFPDGGLNVLTNSRIQTFLTCPEKHRLRYEEGIRKASSEEIHYLRWGTLFHKLMEVVWSSY